MDQSNLEKKLKEEPKDAENISDNSSIGKDPDNFKISAAMCKTELDDPEWIEYDPLNKCSRIKGEECKFHEVPIKIEKIDSDAIDDTGEYFIDPFEIKIKNEPEEQNTDQNKNSKRRKRTTQNTDQRKIHSCDLCSYSTKIFWNFKKHTLVHKKGSNDLDVERYKCTSCSYETLIRGNMVAHMAVHDRSRARAYPCSTCGFIAYRKSNLARHEARHTGAPGEFACPHCDKRYKEKMSVNHHILITHPEFIETISSQVYQCSFCPFKTVRKCQMPDHLLKHTQDNAVEYKCNTCGYSTYKKHKYTLHMRIHAGDAEFTCEICERGFCHKYHLQEHILRQHSNDGEMMKRVVYKVYSCDVCGYRTVLVSNFRKHMESRHKPRSS